MPAIDLSILNQRQTPAFYADVFANRPAAGFVGRIFVSTNTFAFYRDNGTGWDLIGGPGSGTITGSGSFGSIALWNGTDTITYDVGLTWDGTANSLTASKFIVTGGTSSQFLKGDGSLDSNTYNTGSGAASQVAFFSGTNAITGENNLWWDSTNNHLGINTNTPATALDVNHNGTLVAKFNNTTSANTLVAFENAGNEQWWIGTENTNNDFLFYDATNFPTLSLRTTFKTNGQVLIGGGSTGSGKLVVESATSDNGIQIVGANAPSLRIDSAATGPTKRIGLGISTGVNNFIQGSVDRDMCIFNGSTTASPMLFGIYDTTNVQEAARISAARNFLIGTTTDAGYKLYVGGKIGLTDDLILNSTNPTITWNSGTLRFYSNAAASVRAIIDASGNFGIGTTSPTGKLDVQGGYSYFNGLRISGADTGNTIYQANGDFSISSDGGNIRLLTNVSTANINFGTQGGEDMRLSSSGNLLIGTTTDAGYKLSVSGETYSLFGFISPGPNFEPTTGTGWVNAAFRSQANTSPYGGGVALIDGTSGWVMYAISSGANFRIASATTTTTPITQFQINNSGNAILSGSIQTANPSGGTAQTWKLGNYTAGVAVQAGKVRVEINGVAYDLLTA